jgi:hypothetical protein
MKSSFVVGMFLSITVLFGAQAVAQVEFGIGPIGGVNFGTVSILPANSLPAPAKPVERTRNMLGAQAELGFADEFFIVFQPTYVEKGFGVEVPTGYSGPLSIAINELEFPLLFKVKFTTGIFRPYAFVGPNLSVVLSANASPWEDLFGRTIPEQDLKSWTFSPDFAIDVGGGAEVNVTPLIGITFDVRYSLGLANTLQPYWNEYIGNRPTTGTLTASGFQILLGVMFHVL